MGNSFGLISGKIEHAIIILRVADKEEAKETAPDVTATSASRIWNAPKFLKQKHCNFFNSESERKPKLVISFTDVKTNLTKEFSTLIESKPLSELENSLEDKKTLWSKIKEHKNGSSAG